jgi:hypothetical protein
VDHNNTDWEQILNADVGASNSTSQQPRENANISYVKKCSPDTSQHQQQCSPDTSQHHPNINPNISDLKKCDHGTLTRGETVDLQLPKVAQ